MSSATWLLPAGYPMPAHLPPAQATVALTDGRRAIGGPLAPGATVVTAAEGYGIIVPGPAPGGLLRSIRPAGVDLQCSCHRFVVPRLLDPGLCYAADIVHRRLQRIDGDLQVETYVEHQALADRVVAILRNLANDDLPDIDDAELWALAIDLLACIYHVSAAEVVAWDWLHDDDPLLIIFAAGAVDVATPAEALDDH